MKHFAILLALTFALFSCKKNEDGPKPPKIVFTVLQPDGSPATQYQASVGIGVWNGSPGNYSADGGPFSKQTDASGKAEMEIKPSNVMVTYGALALGAPFFMSDQEDTLRGPFEMDKEYHVTIHTSY